MCGIVATRCGVVTPADLDAALEAARTRGPDDRGTWVGAGVGLGHSRLAIVGERGTQPIANEDGSVRVVVNGEFYDFERIRSDLERRGHRFGTDTDSEILVHLYEEHGERCVEHLRGEFAFALYDHRERRLLLGRDRFGIKPLCFARRGEDFFAASEAKQLFALGVRCAWDRDSFHHAVCHQYLPPGRTLFDGVRQLRPGHLLVVDDRGVRETEYWDLGLPRRRPSSVPDAAGELRERLDESVRLRLRADVPIACCLSGGLDSATVLAFAARHHPGLDSFGVSFDHGEYDEGRRAAAVAERLGSRFHPVRVTQDDLVLHLADAVWHAEGLAINGQLVGKYLLSRAVRDAGFKVVLTGEGSDELFAGYAHLQRDGGRRSSEPAQSGIMLPDGPALALPEVERALGFVPTFLTAKVAFGRRIAKLLHDGARAEHRPGERIEALLAAFDRDRLDGRHPVDQSAYLWTRLALANYILRTLGDGTEMAHSVEGRPVFLDHQLAEFAATLPMSRLVGPALEKSLLRDAVRELVPEAARLQPKHPFLAPPLTAFATARVRDHVQDALRTEPGPWFDRDRVRAWADRIWREGTPADDPVLMTLLSCGAVQERFRPEAGDG